MAAVYVGLSRSAFEREASAGRIPRPVALTPGERVWLRDKLDRWLDGRAGRAPAGDGSEWMAAWAALSALEFSD